MKKLLAVSAFLLSTSLGVGGGLLAKHAPAVQATSLSDFSNKMEKNVLNGDGIDARFSIRYVSGSIFVDVAVKDEALTDVNQAGFEMLFYAGEVPTGDTAVPLTKDSPGEIVSFNLFPWLPCNPQGNGDVAPVPFVLSGGQAGNEIFRHCVWIDDNTVNGYKAYHLTWTLKDEYAAVVEEKGKFGFDIRYVNLVGDKKMVGWSSDSAHLYDDMRKMDTFKFKQEGIEVPEADYVITAPKFNVSPLKGGYPKGYMSTKEGLSEDGFIQAAWDEESLHISMIVKDQDRSSGGTADWGRLAIDFGGLVTTSVDIKERQDAGCYAFNLGPWLPNSGGVPSNYGGDKSNGKAILKGLDLSYVQEEGRARIYLRATPTDAYKEKLKAGTEIGFSIQYNDDLTGGNDGTASKNFYVWGDNDGILDNDMSKMGKIVLVENPNGETKSGDELCAKPYFEGDEVLNESVLFIENEDGTIPDAPLLYHPTEIVSLRSSDLFFEFEEGVDYAIVDGKIHLLEGTRIPVVRYEDYYPSAPNTGMFGGTMDKVGGGYVSFREQYMFHLMQVAITYKHAASWDSNYPVFGKARLLPKTMAKLQSDEPMKIAVLGDSVSEGANATGLIKAPPYTNKWTSMVVNRLKDIYQKDNIELNVDYAKGGMDSNWGLQQAPNVGALNPDLVIIEFAGNEGPRPPRTYMANILRSMNAIKKANPDCEFILVTNFLTNPEAVMNQDCYKNIPLYSEQLLGLEGEGVACADVYSAHLPLLHAKRFADMTGNNINHPNDFLVRLYAQVILRTLSNENPLPEKPLDPAESSSSGPVSSESSAPIASESSNPITSEDSSEISLPSSSDSSGSSEQPSTADSLAPLWWTLGGVGVVGVAGGGTAIALHFLKKKRK